MTISMKNRVNRVSIVALTGLVGWANANAAEPKAAELGNAVVNTVREQFQTMSRLAVVAQVTVELPVPIEGIALPVGAPIRGSFEYFADGVSWKKRAEMDADLWPAMNTDIGYSGQMYWYYTPSTGVATVSIAGDEKQPGMTLPNPIFALGQFLIPETNHSNDVWLADLRESASQPLAPIGEWRVGKSGEIEATFPGAELDGAPYSFVVHCRVDGAAISRIDRISNTGELLTRTTFDQWQTVGDGGGGGYTLPALVEFVGYQDGAPAATMTFAISELAANAPRLEDVSFAPPVARADRVWLDEASAFIK